MARPFIFNIIFDNALKSIITFQNMQGRRAHKRGDVTESVTVREIIRVDDGARYPIARAAAEYSSADRATTERGSTDRPSTEPQSVDRPSRELPFHQPSEDPPLKELPVITNVRDAIFSIVSWHDVKSVNKTQPLLGNGHLHREPDGECYVICPAQLVISRADDETADYYFRFVLVTISNLNDEKRSYTFLAQLHSLDGAINLAILQLPEAKINAKHPSLLRGRSPNCPVGTNCLMIGNIRPADPGPLAAENCENGACWIGVADNLYVDYAGAIHGQHFLLDRVIPNVGQPLLSSTGRWLGYNIGNGRVLAEISLRRSLRALLSNESVLHRVDRPVATFDKQIINVRCYRKWILGIRARPLLSHELFIAQDGSLIKHETPIPLRGYRIVANSSLLEGGGPAQFEVGDILVSLRSSTSPENNLFYPGDRRGDHAPEQCVWLFKQDVPVVVNVRKWSENFARIHSYTLLPYPLPPQYDLPVVPEQDRFTF